MNHFHLSLNEYFQVSVNNGVKLYRSENRTGILDENKSFQQETLNPGDTLFGFVQEIQYTILVINTHNNKSARLELERTATLRSVRDSLAKSVGLNRGNFGFFKDPVASGGVPLDENKTFEELDIAPLGSVYLREDNEGGF